jgi:hypothetical protein
VLGRDSQACQGRGIVLRCQSIKCLDVRAGTVVMCVWEPSSEANLTRGGVHPSSEADLTRGGVQASSEVDLTRGGIQVGRGGHQGCDRFSVCVFRLMDQFVFCVFYEVTWVFPRLFRGPSWLSPTVGVNTKKWYRRKADLWADLGDEYHSAGKISSEESVKDACGRQCSIVRQKDYLRF